MKRTFPLDWPSAQPRTPMQVTFAPAGCKDTLTTAATRLERAMNLRVFSDVELSTSVNVGAKGGYVSEGTRLDPAAALSFGFQGRRYHVGQDGWIRVAHNVWSLALMAEGLRQTVRHAGDALFERMIAGFAALPAPGATSPTVRAPHQVLGVAADAPEAVVEAAYRALARDAHPDGGGSDARMAELNAARDAMRRTRG